MGRMDSQEIYEFTVSVRTGIQGHCRHLALKRLCTDVKSWKVEVGCIRRVLNEVARYSDIRQ